MRRAYKNIVFTDHALRRLAERQLSQPHIWQVLNQPQKIKPGTRPGTKKYIKTVKDRRIHVVAQKQTLSSSPAEFRVISVWVRGEEDQAPLLIRLIKNLINLIT